MLERVGLTFSVEKPEVDESLHRGERPEDYVKRLSWSKACVVSDRQNEAWVLAADTTVVSGKRVLGKPADAVEARRMLRQLSGRSHEVLTSFSIISPRKSGVRLKVACKVARTAVAFSRLSAEQIEWYINTDEPYDKAGGYAIQGIAGSFIREIRGSHTNVIGLPVLEVLESLRRMGYPLPWSTT